MGVIGSAPACAQTSGLVGFDHKKPVCLASQTSGSFCARMLIGTSISCLMSTNWANEFAAERTACVVAAEEEGHGSEWRGTHLDAGVQMLTHPFFHTAV